RGAHAPAVLVARAFSFHVDLLDHCRGHHPEPKQSARPQPVLGRWAVERLVGWSGIVRRRRLRRRQLWRLWRRGLGRRRLRRLRRRKLGWRRSLRKLVIW